MKFSPALFKPFLVLLLAFAFFQCEKDALQDDRIPGNAAVETRDGHIPDILCQDLCGEDETLLTFEDLTPDQAFPAEYNGITLSAVARNGIDPLPVWVFDTDRTLEEALAQDCQGFNDDDLLFPGGPFDNVLVIQENQIGSTRSDDCANDRLKGGAMNFDFSNLGSVTVNCLTFFDTEEQEVVDGQPVSGVLTFFDADNNLIGGDFIAIPGVEDGGATVVEVGYSGVVKMQILFLGSGAVSSICLSADDDDPGCTYTQGYWKNHEEDWCVPTDMTFDGCNEGWLDLLNTPVKGNDYVKLAHQYIAAYLNVNCSDADTDDIAEAYAAAGDWLNTYCPDSYPREDKGIATQLNDILDEFNKGNIGPGHCDDMEMDEDDD